MDPTRLQSIVKRVAQGVLSRGSAGVGQGGHPGGVYVELAPSGGNLRPADPDRHAAPLRDSAGSRVVTAEELAATADGGTFSVPAGARVTPLAREEAWARGIELNVGTPTSGQRLRVAVGSDHGGYPVKEEVKTWLAELGHAVLDLGTHDTRAVDYPDFARAVGEAVASGRADLGVCVDGAGIGSSIAANKVPGVRAALCYDERTARNAREHNFANVLSLGGPLLGSGGCSAVLRAFLETPEGAARHARRVDKIGAIEAHYTGRQVPTRRIATPPGTG
jgi:ribose 5-phosphate isomerase B